MRRFRPDTNSAGKGEDHTGPLATTWRTKDSRPETSYMRDAVVEPMDVWLSINEGGLQRVTYWMPFRVGLSE